jgi:hypothetical protein
MRKSKSNSLLLRNLFQPLFLSILAGLLAACNLPRATPAIPTFTPSATNTPLVNTPTPTNTAPVPLPSNPTPTNTSSTSTGLPINILFATGTTAVVESGRLQAGQIQNYTINVGNSQPMILILNSTVGDDYLAVYDADGKVVLDPAKKWSRWQSLLTQKIQLYTIRVIGGASTEDFTLTVKVAARIKFAAGATSATVEASTVKGYVLTYAVTGLADQTMTVNLDAPANSVALDIFGLATGDLLLGANEKATTFEGTLPSTQDYIIEVYPLLGDVVDFSMTVAIH